MIKKFRYLTAMCATLLVFSAHVSHAQAPAYPSKPIRLVVPMPPGGGTDYWARLTTTKMADALGQPILIDNKPGAGTRIAAEMVAHAPADGYTLLIGDIGTFSVNPHLYPKLSYDPVKDFRPISLTVRQALVLGVPTSSDFRSVADLVASAKANPGKLNYGSASIGSPHHLAMELFQSLAGVQMNHIAYKGGVPLVIDVVGGQVQAAFMDLPSAMPQIKAGRLRGLAVFSDKRLKAFPDIPTISESGYPGHAVEAWQGVVAPAGTPKEVLDRINSSYAAVSKDPDVINKLSEMGMEATPSTPQAFSDYMKSQTAAWGAIIRDKKISAE